MFLEVDRYVDFITKNKLTQPQFLLMYLIYRKRYNSILKYKETYPTEDGSMIGKPALQDLIDNGFILKINDENKADSYTLTEKFSNLFFKDKYNAIEALIEVYPGFIEINGVPSPLITTDRFKLASLYAEHIDYSVDEHLLILEDTKFGREKNLIRCNIEKYITSNMWNKIREIRLHQSKIEKIDTIEEF
jgi:hypothetical protein